MDARTLALQLADPASTRRPELLRDAVRVLGAKQAASLTDTWRLPPAPDFLNYTKHGALPGTIRCLLEMGALADDSSGLSLLGWLVARFDDTLQVVPDQPGHQRLDQVGWPCTNDARVALRAVRQLPNVPPMLGDSLRTIEAYLVGHVALGAELPANLARAACASLVASGASTADAITIAEQLVAPAVAASCRPLVTNLATDRGVLGDPKVLEAGWLLAQTAQSAHEGWTAYHAHRGLPSYAAQAAAATVKAVSAITGVAWAQEAVFWAIELATQQDNNDLRDSIGRVVSAARPRTVKLLWPESEQTLATGLAVALEGRGCLVRQLEVHDYPIADSLVYFCQRALDDCDVLLVVLTAKRGSTWLRRELETQLRLAAIRPRVVLLLRSGSAHESPDIAVLDLCDTNAPEVAMRRLDQRWKATDGVAFPGIADNASVY